MLLCCHIFVPWWRNLSVFGRMCMCPSLSEPVRPTKTLGTPYLKNRWSEFHQFCSQMYCVVRLSRFWCQKIKGQGNSRRRYNRRQQPVEFHLVFFLFTWWQTNLLCTNDCSVSPVSLPNLIHFGPLGCENKCREICSFVRSEMIKITSSMRIKQINAK